MVVVDPNRKAFRFFLLSLPVLTYFILEFATLSFIPRVEFPTFYLVLTRNVTALGTFLISYLSIRFYYKIREKDIDHLTKVNDDLKETLYESQKQKTVLEKVSQQAAFTTLSMGIAHEIRNPMFNLLARAEIIEEEPHNEKEVLKFAEMIKRNISRILNITNTMLKYGNPVVSEKSKVSVKSILNEIVDIVKGKCFQKKIKMTIDFQDVPLVVVDSGRIHQAILNIVLNSIESMEDSGGELSIKLSKSSFINSENKSVEGISIIVTDTGSGVKPEIKDSIFDPFFTTKYKNTGLGLAIALKNIHTHKGLISLESEPDKGAVFTVYIPLETT